jgi:uncharacterized membrane protein
VSRIRPKYVLFGIVATMMVIVLYNNESFLIDPDHPVWQHYEPFKWWLLPHGIAGALALFLGPLQFSDRLRQKYLRLHRISGRIYVAGVAIAAPLGAHIQILQGPPLFNAAALVDAALWMLTTGIAFFFALRGNIQQHKQWMTRSFAVALVFLEVRVILYFFPAIEKNMGIDGVMMVVWICVVFAVFLGDVVLQAEELLRKRPLYRNKAAIA